MLRVIRADWSVDVTAFIMMTAAVTAIRMAVFRSVLSVMWAKRSAPWKAAFARLRAELVTLARQKPGDDPARNAVAREAAIAEMVALARRTRFVRLIDYLMACSVCQSWEVSLVVCLVGTDGPLSTRLFVGAACAGASWWITSGFRSEQPRGSVQSCQG